MRRRTFAVGAVTVLILGFAVALGARGDTNEQTEQEKIDEALAGIEEELEKVGPIVGLGEADPPRPDEWKTDFSKRLVPLLEIGSGGPPKDGIPAIDEPQFTPADDVDWLEDREPVIAVEIGEEARAYPIQVLMWHEIANDQIGDTPVAVTFCPLCNTAIVFDRRVNGEAVTFGTTGKLRNSDLVMYDRKTESWWQQFSGEAIVGELVGTKLEQLPTRITSWQDFRSAHPSSLVLNRETGFERDYGRNPYAGYDDVGSSPLFAAENDSDDRLQPKERVVYVEVGDRAFAVPFPALAEKRAITLETDAGELVVRWRAGVASALDGSGVANGRDVGAATVTLGGKAVPFHEPFWFAVAAFRPDIEIVGG